MSDLAVRSFADATFNIRIKDDAPAFFLFGVRKSGSSIMNAMVASLAQMNGVNYVDVAGKLFERGLSVASWQNAEELGDLLHGGNIFSGFRNAPLGIAGHPLVKSSKQVLLVRDPRDALVSEYFSNAYSHSIPEEGEARAQMLEQRAKALHAQIGPYVRRMAENFRRSLQEYDHFLSNPGMRLYRYEQAILDKRWFLTDLCAHFGWRATPEQIGHILGWADVLPSEENPTQFIRKVTPGDHLDKLDTETIEYLTDFFHEQLTKYGYKVD